MIWRLWTFVALLPLGVLVGLAAAAPPSAPRVAAFAVGAAACGVLLASWLARRGDDEPERGRHMARAASVGLAALPLAVASAMEVGPGALPLAAAMAAAVAFVLWRASRSDGPGPALPTQLLSALVALVLGGLVATLGSWAWARASGGAPNLPPAVRRAVLDLDASVPLDPRLDCSGALVRHRVLSDRGAHPRLDRDGRHIWVDAEGPDGNRQIHRLDIADGRLRCWTCDQPGNNQRPAPNPRVDGLVYDTDRFATARTPDDTELMLVATRGDAPPAGAGLRLTGSPGPDQSALFDPSGGALVWSHGGRGRFEVALASLEAGHGGVALGRPMALLGGGDRYVTPLGWSADARSLAVGSGSGLALLEVSLIDPGSGAERRLPVAVAPDGIAYSGDGQTLAAASALRVGTARLVPAGLGFATGRWTATAGRPAPLALHGSTLFVGARDGTLRAVELGELADFGAPTGVSLAADGRAVALGQRAESGAERILWLELRCTP